jgi:hypothetical protein
MTEHLSPAAQAVLDAAFDPWQSTDTPASIAAAALRAAADQVVPTTVDPRLSTVRSDLMRIAAELEAQ